MKVVELSKSKLRALLRNIIKDRWHPTYMILWNKEDDVLCLSQINSIKQGIEELEKGYLWLLSVVPYFYEDTTWGYRERFGGYWLASASGLDHLIKAKRPDSYFPNIPKVVMDALKKGELTVYKLKRKK